MYYRVWDTILKNMKKRFMEETGLSEEAFLHENETYQVQETYYLRKVEDNLIKSMEPIHKREFSKGKSVVTNLNYLASSYGMTYNFLGNHQINFLENVCGVLPASYSIAYKKTFRALKSKNAFVNMDAFLLSEDGVSCVCVEMKLLEWFVFKINPIKDNFMEPENYYYPDTARMFMDVIQLLIPYLDRDGWEHLGIFRYCDGFLTLRQILGLYNAIRLAKEGVYDDQFPEVEKLKRVKRITLITAYWYAQNPESYGTYMERILKAEQQLQKEAGFLREIMEPIVNSFEKSLGVNLKLVSIDYKNFLRGLDKTEEERQALSRYDI